jgi:hypothetical protein
VTIVDWEATSLEVRAALLDKVIKSGKFAELSIWTVSLSTAEKRLLGRQGFSSIESKDDLSHGIYIPSVLVRPTNPEKLHGEWVIGGRDLRNIEDWKLRAIDSDGA